MRTQYWKDGKTFVEAGSPGNWVDEVSRVARLPPSGVFNGAVGGATACKADTQITFQQQAYYFASNAGGIPAGTTTAAVIMLGEPAWWHVSPSAAPMRMPRPAGP